MMIVVEKFGGTSMADPSLVLERVVAQSDPAAIVVVSAPGVDAHNPVKLTDMLRNYQASPSAIGEEAVVERIGSLAEAHLGPALGTVYRDSARADITEFTDYGWPLDALGEYWSGRIFAALSGREFLDPREVIRFTSSGRLDERRSQEAIRCAVQADKQYVLPGYFGSQPDGSVDVLPRGGSDITGALAAKAVGSAVYRNWSDVPGFLSADPKRLGRERVRFLSQLTYMEAREFGKKGTELLHRAVPALLGESDVVTIMCDTFSGQQGTEISRSRNWQTLSLAGVTVDHSLVGLSYYEYGMNEEAGRTTKLFYALSRNEIPYEDSATGTDDVAVTIHREHLEKLEKATFDHTLLARLTRRELASLHLIGEGLANSRVRMRALRDTAAALDEAGVGSEGVTDAGESPGMTFFIVQADAEAALAAAHSVIEAQYL